MNRKLFLFCFCLLIVLNPLINAQKKVIKIWQYKIPGAIENSNYNEEDFKNENGIYRILRISEPTISVFVPGKEKVNGTAIIICPGGGYAHLAWWLEGTEIAKWLNDIGIAAFVLKYRLPSDSIMKNKSIGPLQDVQEAVRIVRRNAKEWNINPNKIGIIGFSAGGHLASTLCTHFDERVYDSDSTSAKPNFSILIYPVISMEENITHAGSRNNLLGDNPAQKEIEHFSNDVQVNQNTPPAFLIQAENDKTVPVQNSVNYFLALKKLGIPAELHIFPKGGHGFGLAKNGSTESVWSKLCESWMRSLSLL